MPALEPFEIDYAEANREAHKRSFLNFVQDIMPSYDAQWFHKHLCNKLTAFSQGKIKRLAVFMPPQHGKSELTSRLFPAYLLAQNPDRKILLCSYAADLAEGFSSSVQRYMGEEEFTFTYPAVKLPDGTRASAGYKRTTQEFQIIGKKGYLKTAGVGGGITGKPADIAIIDDPVKGREDAHSPTIQEKNWGWYNSDFKSRLHNKSQVLLIMTRWAEEDLGGKILEREKGWEVIKFPALRTNEINPDDPRKEGEPLWPAMHSFETLMDKKSTSEVTWDSLYQQEPKAPKHVLVFPNWQTINAFPPCPIVIRGMDYGFTNDPTALIKVGINGRNIYLEEELYEKGLTNSDIAIRLDKLGLQKAIIYADSAEQKTNEELRRGVQFQDGRRLSFLVIDAIKGSGSIDEGIGKLKEYNLFITANSHNLIAEANHYQFIAVGDTITNIPVDKWNHLWDAARYAVFTYTFVPRPARVKNRASGGYGR